jgi:hypothetical protein
MDVVEVSKLQLRKGQDLWNGLHAGNAAFSSYHLMSTVSYLNTCMFNREMSECVCFVPVMKRVSYIKRGAQSKNMWEQNDEKNMWDRQVQNLHFFYVSLTVHLGITFVKTNLTHSILVLQYVYYIYYIPLHVSNSNMLIIRRLNCINRASGVVTLCRWPFGTQVATCVPKVHLQTVTIPDALLIQFNLLMISMLLLEACSGM